MGVEDGEDIAWDVEGVRGGFPVVEDVEEGVEDWGVGACEGVEDGVAAIGAEAGECGSLGVGCEGEEGL